MRDLQQGLHDTACDPETANRMFVCVKANKGDKAGCSATVRVIS